MAHDVRGLFPSRMWHRIVWFVLIVLSDIRVPQHLRNIDKCVSTYTASHPSLAIVLIIRLLQCLLDEIRSGNTRQNIMCLLWQPAVTSFYWSFFMSDDICVWNNLDVPWSLTFVLNSFHEELFWTNGSTLDTLGCPPILMALTILAVMKSQSMISEIFRSR
jgi:hypothetical protein